MSYQFFLSYARDDDDLFLRNFYRDLTHEVRLLTPGDVSEVAFRDTESMLLGERWSDKLLHALQTCKVFVALCSPTYFTRHWCGREWQFFHDRLEEYQQPLPAGSHRPALMIPIKWIACSDIPDCVNEYQLSNQELGSIYEQEGLRYLQKLHRDDYVRCVYVIAKTIVHAASTDLLNDSERFCLLKEVPNAFEENRAGEKSDRQPVSIGGPRYAQFVYIVGRRQELSRLRRNVDAYGDLGAEDWRPYDPPVDDSMMLLAQQAALSEQLISDTLEFNEHVADDLVEKIRQAEDQSKIVLILLDPWTLGLELYRMIMRKYDETRFFNAAVLVPWNENDIESESQADRLLNQIKVTLYRQTGATLGLDHGIGHLFSTSPKKM
ncbi:TIR-like protein FxsC, partial [Candidatus Entotheonella palauensis]|uniref:TIR-like protein FxsC n=1 Tax=Candidatus Entotheonella palauensis TaxID=93172 RepID=UPI000B7E5ADB